jgi:hypothetical protein
MTGLAVSLESWLPFDAIGAESLRDHESLRVARRFFALGGAHAAIRGRYRWGSASPNDRCTAHGGLSFVECLVPVLRIWRRRSKVKKIAPHELEAELLSVENVNEDVASLSKALAEEQRRKPMSVQMVIELREKQSAQPILQAIESYKTRLRAGIKRTRRRLAQFEQCYGVDTAHFLQEMAAEDLEGGDLEYVEWAGEAKLLEGLEAELTELEHARYQLP